MYCKKLHSIRTKLTEEIDVEVCPYGVSGNGTAAQHDAQWDILIEPAARRRAAIEARGHSELGAFGTAWGRNRVVITNLLLLIVCYRETYCAALCWCT